MPTKAKTETDQLTGSAGGGAERARRATATMVLLAPAPVTRRRRIRWGVFRYWGYVSAHAVRAAIWSASGLRRLGARPSGWLGVALGSSGSIGSITGSSVVTRIVF